MSSQFREVSAGGGATALETISIEDLAAETANPALFLDKYEFCVTHLGFNQQQAVRWASRIVKVSTIVKRALAMREHKAA